ncbi:collagen-like triple helix repeat-containing protein [Mucilaginibacter auburnensis]|uniref:Collagen triple helix repeat protein n=1 Tax=Mucilaginibacter auburnensis TaxID=1457233 RepID=A0A2H9VNX2_9SPHI|nr:collagen-like protein [Mucilaginibacter auburnensis]PJJ80017.1 collagen triple helix repeat protein [Mucilaginibacter auburnensis]
MKQKNYFYVAMVILALASACKKGDEGPKGPAGNNGKDGAAGVNGKDGAQGPAGPKGDTGATGPAGTANVIYSDWAYAKNFRDTVMDNSNVHAADIAAPKLTSALLNNATIMVYFTFGGGVYVLPYTSYAGSKLNTINFAPRAGRIVISRFTADNTNSVNLSTLLQYRYIIIPGGIKATEASKINVNSYEAVLKYYGVN